MSEEIIYELFLQAGPIESVSLKGGFGFVTFEDEESVLYSCSLFEGVRLFDQELKIKPRAGSKYANQKFTSVPPYLNGGSSMPSRGHGHSSDPLGQQVPRLFVAPPPFPNHFPYDANCPNAPLLAPNMYGEHATNSVFSRLSQCRRTLSYGPDSFAQKRSDFNGGSIGQTFPPVFPPLGGFRQNSSDHVGNFQRSYSSGYK
ncbi:unnamed protein product [Dibothriocephalus latus]|uniref:RRM domain-containing protein n=1 Tax=Dibothriocephalus latus TaxID=60516 RepID=A0A3P7NGM9_DIBLA|nr:unnamed protein product [Dibothriocephalus latus]